MTYDCICFYSGGMTVAAVRQQLAAAFRAVSPSPQLDADCILQHVLNCDKTQLLLRRADMLTAPQLAAVRAAADRRKTGLPIAYITGHKEFFGYDFLVTPAVLIPKPDTELLVELALQAVHLLAGENARSVCDMCAGSGCVGVSLLCALSDSGAVAPPLTLTFSDSSAEALAVARQNADRLLPPAALGQVRFVQSDLFARFSQTFDLIVANPPYVPHDEALSLLQDGRGEPLLALDGDVAEDGTIESRDGLSLIRRLVPQAYARLVSGGALLMETGEYNAEAAAALCQTAGFCDVVIERDLSGQLRVVCARKPVRVD